MFLDRILNNDQILNCKKIRPVGPEFNLDGRTDGRAYRHDEVNSDFSQFCERS
jgi:hypothetical protein